MKKLLWSIPFLLTQALALDPLGDRLAGRFDVMWQKDGLIVSGLPPAKDVKVRVYTDKPHNSPLTQITVEASDRNYLKAIAGVGVMVGIFQSCQGLKEPGEVGDFIGRAVVNVPTGKSAHYERTIGGFYYRVAVSKLSGKVTLKVLERYPAGTVGRCALSRKASH